MRPKYQRKRSCFRSSDIDIRAIPVFQKPFSLLAPDEFSIRGAAPKHFLVLDKTCPKSHAYVAKQAKNCGAKECVTEHLITQIGKTLPLRIASSAIVRLPAEKGPPSDVRFLSRFFLKPGDQLIHGVELAEQWLGACDVNEVTELFSEDERELYTVETIIDMFNELFPSHREFLCDGLGRMLAFDALVGANDRHAENWGVVERASGVVHFAPIYDTARALLWQYPEKQLESKIANGQRCHFLESYACGSKPLIGCPPLKCINHFELIKGSVEYHNEQLGRSIRSVLGAFNQRRIWKLLNYQFGRVFSPLRRSLIYDLLLYRYDQLRRCSGL